MSDLKNLKRANSTPRASQSSGATGKIPTVDSQPLFVPSVASSKSSLYGIPLPEEGKVPDIFDICMTFLEAYGEDNELLFQKPGDKVRVDALKHDFDYGRRSELNEDENVHNVANVLLYWLKSLTNSVIPHQHYQRLIDTNNLSPHKRARVFKEVFEVLPKLRLEMLRRIIRLARKLALVKLAKIPGKEREKEKLRVFEEEAAIFAPFLLRPKEGKADLKAITTTVVNMIDLYPDTLKLFKVKKVQLIAPAGKRPAFHPEIVKWYLEYKYTEMFATKKNPIARKHHRAIPIYTPETLKSFVEAKKEEEELKRFIQENVTEYKEDNEEHKIKGDDEVINVENVNSFNSALDWVSKADIDKAAKLDPNKWEKLKAEEEERKKRELEERRRKADEEFERKQKEAEEKRRQEELERKQKQKEMRRHSKLIAEEIVKQEFEERKKQLAAIAEEERKQEEEAKIRKQKEEEERRRAEEQRLKEIALKAQEELRLAKEREEKRKEEERKQREAELERAAKKREEELRRKKQAEEEKLQKIKYSTLVILPSDAMHPQSPTSPSSTSPSQPQSQSQSQSQLPTSNSSPDSIQPQTPSQSQFQSRTEPSQTEPSTQSPPVTETQPQSPTSTSFLEPTQPQTPSLSQEAQSTTQPQPSETEVAHKDDKQLGSDLGVATQTVPLQIDTPPSENQQKEPTPDSKSEVISNHNEALNNVKDTSPAVSEATSPATPSTVATNDNCNCNQ
jgi:hypothetical protein